MYFFRLRGPSTRPRTRYGAILICGITALMVGGWNWGTYDKPAPAPELPDCGKCPRLAREIRKFREDAQRADLLLTHQHQELGKIDPNEASLRMKMASAMFVLAAQLETAQNREKVRQNLWNYNCGPCTPEQRGDKSNEER